VIKSLIVAHAKNYEIGLDNQLLWHLSDDLKNFKNHTLNKPIVMGRKTFDSIGRVLPKRTNIILTTQMDLKIEGALVMNSYKEIDSWASENDIQELVYIGGGKVYQDVIGEIDRMYITRVLSEFKADTFFPQYDESEFNKSEYYQHPKDEMNNHPWEFFILDKK